MFTSFMATLFDPQYAVPANKIDASERKGKKLKTHTPVVFSTGGLSGVGACGVGGG